MTDEQLAIFVRAVHEELTITAATSQCFPHIPAMLSQLVKRCECALITGNVLSAAKSFLDNNQLTACFGTVYGAENPGTKSDKIRKLADDAGYPLSSIYYIGDAGTDIQQGRIAGSKTIAVP
jgi:phosphoglycolate phosphatase-like HAD superfamily hydrolase